MSGIAMYRFVGPGGERRGTAWAMCRFHALEQKVPAGLTLEKLPGEGDRLACHDCKTNFAIKGNIARLRFLKRVRLAA